MNTVEVLPMIWAAGSIVSVIAAVATAAVRTVRPHVRMPFEWAGSIFLLLSGLGLVWLEPTSSMLGFALLLVGLLWLITAITATFKTSTARPA